MIVRHCFCGQPAIKQARLIGTAASRASGSHPAVYHDDFALSPLPEGHRFPMPKDHLLYCELQKRGWAARTFRPVAPDVETLSLVRHQTTLCRAWFPLSQAHQHGFVIVARWHPAARRKHARTSCADKGNKRQPLETMLTSLQ